MLRLAHLLIATLVLAFLSLPAMADSRPGTHAWSATSLTLRDGPSTAYTVTGQVDPELSIRVLRCQKTWCLVDGDTGRGWTHKASISFGKTPDIFPQGQQGKWGRQVCFYTGTNYTGAEYCFSSGQSIDDLKLSGLDNLFASVRVDENSVAACRDRFFQSYCERIVQSQPVLNQYLVQNLSSIRVY